MLMLSIPLPYRVQYREEDSRLQEIQNVSDEFFQVN
jgi:hypothetical protein